MEEEKGRKVKAFCQALMEEEKSKATIEKYGSEIQRMYDFLKGRSLEKIALLEYREYLKKQYKPQTVNGKLCAINAYLKFIKREDCKIRLLRVQRRAFIEEARELKEEEYKRLLEAAKERKKERLYYLMLTIGGTGIRISELPYITVEAVKAGRAEISMKGKIRVVLISKKLRKLLKEYANRQGIRSGCLFQTKNKKPLDRSNIYHEMKGLCQKARVDAGKVFPHNFRHLFARTFYAVQKNLAHLADVLGHSSVETTRIYVAVSEKEHEKTLMRMRLVI